MPPPATRDKNPPVSAYVVAAIDGAERDGRRDWLADNKRLPLIFYTAARTRLAAQQAGGNVNAQMPSVLNSATSLEQAAASAAALPALTAAACRITAESAHVALAAAFPASDLKAIARDLMLCAQASRVFSGVAPAPLRKEAQDAADVAEAAARKIDPAEAARLDNIGAALSEVLHDSDDDDDN